MSIEMEDLIQRALGALLPGTACAAIVREATRELSAEELTDLSAEQKAKWKRLGTPARTLEWSEGRRCERKLKEKLGAQALTSISHSRRNDVPVVFAIGVAGGAARVGIDVELKTRAVSDAVANRFIAPDEDRRGLEALQLWVIKEALFKADPLNAGTAISHHCLTSYDPGTRTGTGQIANRSSRFALVDVPDWIVAVAASVG